MNDESTSSQNPAAEQVTVELDENDVPGALLSARLESHTVPEQKWWLSSSLEHIAIGVAPLDQFGNDGSGQLDP